MDNEWPRNVPRAWQKAILMASTLIVWSIDSFLFELTRAVYFPYGNRPQRLLGDGEIVKFWIAMSGLFLTYSICLWSFLMKSQLRRTDYIQFGLFVGGIVVAQVLMIFFPWWPVG